MPDLVQIPPARRPELILRPLGARGQYVVKDPRTGGYFQLGEEEHFLLDRLDGVQTEQEIRQAFETRFGGSLSDADFRGFLGLADSQGFLVPPGKERPAARPAPAPTPAPVSPPPPPPPPAPAESTAAMDGMKFLYWRRSLFDPDRLLDRLAPRLWAVWTLGFLVLSVCGIAAAAVVAWGNRTDLVGGFAGAVRWETAVVVWLTLTAATTLHEFAHGLTCKHFGGEVHEIGVLAVFFIPCLYCNVSDAWLIPEKWKRLLITLAGGYCDLCLWAVAVFVWRLTPPGGLPNYLAWVVLSVLLTRVVFNFNPLLKLDGYYLLSDWLEVPNLQKRGWDRVKAHLRRLLWGSPPPAADPQARLVLAYGLVSWMFAAAFLGLMLLGLTRLLWARGGFAGLAVAGLLAAFFSRGVLRGVAGEEARQMVLTRRARTAGWGGALVAVAAIVTQVQIEDHAGGTFRVRPAVRADLRAPVSGFVREVRFDEGDRVKAGEPVFVLDIPDLASRLAQKGAEVREARAKLALLEAGPRPEEVAEQRARVFRARTWHELARQDLDRARKGYDAELERLRLEGAEREVEQRFARDVVTRSETLRARGAGAEQDFEDAKRRLEVTRTQMDQLDARRRALRAVGLREPEAELAKRAKELADAEGVLGLMEAGTRPEEIAAARAHLARVEEEARYLESLQGRLIVPCPVGGVITTPRLREKVGQYLHEGDLLGEVEEVGALEVEVALAEQDAARVLPGQPTELRPRAFASGRIAGHVIRVAPCLAGPDTTRQLAATGAPPPPPRGEAPGTAVVYCRLEEAPPDLRPGMTGYARVGCGDRTIAEVVGDRVRRFLRTEFWW